MNIKKVFFSLVAFAGIIGISMIPSINEMKRLQQAQADKPYMTQQQQNIAQAEQELKQAEEQSNKSCEELKLTQIWKDGGVTCAVFNSQVVEAESKLYRLREGIEDPPIAESKESLSASYSEAERQESLKSAEQLMRHIVRDEPYTSDKDDKIANVCATFRYYKSNNMYCNVNEDMIQEHLKEVQRMHNN